jgi:dCMP deaminase
VSSRLTIDQYWCSHLRLVAQRSTCLRRKVGAIITDEKGAILSSGYNGMSSGLIHCGEPDSACPGEKGKPGDSGNETTSCWAVHAEQNSILQCHRLDLAHTMYCTNFPCFTCAKMIGNLGIKKIVALEDYPGDKRGLQLLLLKGLSIRVGDQHVRMMADLYPDPNVLPLSLYYTDSIL